MAGNFGGIDALRRNRKIEGEEGIDLRIPNSEVVLHVLAATDSNPKWRALKDKTMKEAARQEKAGASAEELQNIWAKLFAAALVIGWKNVVDAEGHPVDFSIENCTKFLSAGEADDAYDAVRLECANTQNFRIARKEAIVDNAKN